MSEINLNLVDANTILAGTIHGSVGDRCVAALSAEPETISELEAALERFQKYSPTFGILANFQQLSTEIPSHIVMQVAVRMSGWFITTWSGTLSGLPSICEWRLLKPAARSQKANCWRFSMNEGPAG